MISDIAELPIACRAKFFIRLTPRIAISVLFALLPISVWGQETTSSQPKILVPPLKHYVAA